MSHIYETEYGRRLLEHWISKGYAVRSNVHQSDTGRFCDAIVHTDAATLIVEVDNDFEAGVGGVGQASMYAGSYRNNNPDEKPLVACVFLPEGHVEHPEAEYIEECSGVQIVEFSP